MSLQQRSYSVLVVSNAEHFNSGIKSIFTDSKYDTVSFVSGISSAKRTFAQRTYDFVIIHSPLPDDFGTRFAIDISNSKNTVILMLVREDIHAEINDKVSEYGIFTLPRPISKHTMTTALSWLSAARERLRKAESKTLSIEEKMEEIRIVNRAKWLLIKEIKMEEPEAHRYIEKMAMDRCIAKRAVAEEIIRTYS